MTSVSPFRLFCIFPHPDDESFLMGGTIASITQTGKGDVALYTLTRGERTRNAAEQNLSPVEVADIRSAEVLEASEILGISSHFQGDYPDGGLRDYDPRDIEKDLAEKIRAVNPHVLCTFDVQGGSVHPDHITLHHVVKRVFVDLREQLPALQRLCFCVLPKKKIMSWPRAVFGVDDDRIHAVLDVAPWRDIEERAVHAHRSVRRDVEENNFDNWMLWEEEYFSFYRETPQSVASSLFDGLHP